VGEKGYLGVGAGADRIGPQEHRRAWQGVLVRRVRAGVPLSLPRSVANKRDDQGIYEENRGTRVRDKEALALGTTPLGRQAFGPARGEEHRWWPLPSGESSQCRAVPGNSSVIIPVAVAPPGG